MSPADSKTAKIPPEYARRELKKLEPQMRVLLADSNLRIVQDCHEVASDIDEDNGKSGHSHSTVYSCYRTDKPLYDALVDFEVLSEALNTTLPDDLQKLERLVAHDTYTFEPLLESYEK